MNRQWTWRTPTRRLDRRGFTLLEIVVALAVMAVAVSILVALYQASSVFAAQNEETRKAVSLAEEHLTDILLNPAAYVWPALTPGKAMEIHSTAGEQRVEPPKSLPPDKTAGLRERSAYEIYAWRAFARLPEENAPYIELTVVIEWQSRGRNRDFALTTFAPKPSSGGAA